MKPLRIAGAGLAGLACGYELARRGAKVVLYERSDAPGGVARHAGGMLAPWCERESAEEEVITLGAMSADWWEAITQVTRRGTLVLAPRRDRAELSRFARRTTQHRAVTGAEIGSLEPDLAGRFEQGLFFGDEAHLNPRQALTDLAQAIEGLGGEIRLGTQASDDVDIDCTGIASPQSDLRPVRGEMAYLHCPGVAITRTIRLLHPRIPVYLVPRGDGLYMIGATMVESSSARPPTLRSLNELFSAAFALHPAFAEASVTETGAGLRPAFPDNLPRLTHVGGTWHLNGLYRHGFLLAPAMATRLAQHLFPENSHEDHRQRRTA
ncbi:FAD-dependent oxidoreductase [Chachezhania antarctica]|uniref:FAD-dependent oxidoreductase n=1 Tax=Chachezhania antarctica TaxID=2340860 RepID=UPI000EAC6DCC|nr:FAD-dependent oxidoreductase [Chachezhania antarctica]|tara:strand:+ start:2605 stop:3573 length:969 start_codon:yes stop_codon:yes gene_type:complete